MKTLIASVAETMRTVAGSVVLLLMFAQVVVVALRYVFSLGWPWALDLLVYCFLFSALLPALFVLIRNVSVRVDVFYSRWPDERRRLVDRIALLVLLFPSMAYACWASLPITLRSWRVLETSPTYGGLPGYFLLKSVLSLVFFALAVAAFVMALRRVPYATEEHDEP
ncbi:TRAP transporter small permease subunit [Chelativorans salis]|uniref:TRAP transporter small permease protein n=1 Tax=Chelativorans salis TaxID=2978478 RepID=A0ABT2LWD0_9HYPH|nr:TRAP transporter small permease subunit [Chelativorans sp. EGI FJ00035]MCT7377908.1 TRAP transporter small permease subunit [Chelativorans sp. EGI FJ00035]